MGARSSRAGFDQWDLNEIERTTGLSVQQIQQEFFQAAGRDVKSTRFATIFLNAVVMMNHDVPRRDHIDFLIHLNNSYGRQQGDGCISAQYGHQ